VPCVCLVWRHILHTDFRDSTPLNSLFDLYQRRPLEWSLCRLALRRCTKVVAPTTEIEIIVMASKEAYQNCWVNSSPALQRENAVGTVRKKGKGAKAGMQRVPCKSVLLSCASGWALTLLLRFFDCALRNNSIQHDSFEPTKLMNHEAPTC
jgi:hypothetical protein